MREPHIYPINFAWTGLRSSLCALGFTLCSLPAGATAAVIPWECTGYAGEAQNRCTRMFAELQQEKITKLEKDLKVEQRMAQQLQEQVARQASVTADLERSLIRERSRWYGSPSVQIYPPFGLTLRFGRDKFFGGLFFYGKPRYCCPRFFHGHGFRRWYRY